MGYYRVHFDGATYCWFPHEPRTPSGEEVDARDFTEECRPYEGPPLVLTTHADGVRAPVILGPFDMPVVDIDFGDALVAVVGDDVQLVPATSEHGPVYILNVLRRIDCIDEQATVGERWQASDGRPDKTGTYRMIIELRLDPTRLGDAEIFRVRGWEIYLIVSERLAREFFAGVPGIKLTAVA